MIRAQYYQGFPYLRYSGLFSGTSMCAAHQKFYCRLFIKDNIMPCRILYLWISALRNSIDFISFGSQFDLSIIDYLSSLYIIQNGVLSAYLHKQTSDQYHYGTVRRCIYIYTAEVQRCLSLELAVQSIWELIVIHILIGIILISIFLCSFHPLSKLRGRNFL